ncbi:hypothetical protein L486_04452 [Kwoniella mangroviensis CBS 10435]|uniref:Major facilitator superfamily (MFS) profile domain-containing protein n=1 Tax=Kwoniella mangroviensis CBS 10435 TaxID=1331196 RepID=A0A1B9ISB9_9TREE|nr:hypothetical protein L486_04452 [Kwoniella mangroviensis CBS 10435]
MKVPDLLERRLLVRLDLSLLVFSTLGLIMRYIDQTNLSTAFPTDTFTTYRREDLNMFGLEYNYFNKAWSVGYVIGQIPGNILLNRVSPHYIVFALEFGWSIMTLCTTWVKNWHQLCFIRFMVGLFESAYYPGLLFLIGSWYTKDELGKRSNIFQAATAAGTLISGVMQAGVYRTLNGKHSTPGWRWIFTIDAAISIPIAISAFFLIPDLPWNIKPNWIFKQHDIRFSEESFVRCWKTWSEEGWTGCYIFSQNPQQSMSFWLKYSINPKYSVEQINYYPSGIWSTQIVSALGFAWISDTFLKGRRWPPLLLVALWYCIDCALLAGLPVYSDHRAGRWVLYYLSGVVNCTPGLLYAWCSEIVGDSSEKRGIVMGTFNSVAFAFNAWLPLLLFKQTEQPAVHKGNIAASVATAFQFIGLLGILYLSTRDQKRRIGAEVNKGELIRSNEVIEDVDSKERSV